MLLAELKLKKGKKEKKYEEKLNICVQLFIEMKLGFLLLIN